MNAKERKALVENMKGLGSEVVVELMKSAQKSSKIKTINPILLKNHTKQVRKYCQQNNIKFADFIFDFD